jgi:uncharacterized membrane protein (DUF441 family)
MYNWSNSIPILGLALATLGALILAELARQDFKERGKWRQARGVVWGAVLLYCGFLLPVVYDVWQRSKYSGLLELLASMAVAILLWWVFSILSGRSKRS